MSRRRRLVPEVIQTSAMDCGPACLKALVEGFGIGVGYGRLREACQTDVDGTSIDTLEQVAVQLGLRAEQVMIPADHVLLDAVGALPAIVVVRQPNGATHFEVLWRRHGPWVQVMDPALGRRWVLGTRLLAELYVHRMAVPAEDWREYAGTAEFLDAVSHRLGVLGASEGRRDALIEDAATDPGWRGLAALDAATRMVSSVVQARGLRRGAAAVDLVERLSEQARDDPDVIPESCWSARPSPRDAAGTARVLLSGAVLVRVSGRRIRADGAAPLSPELVAALDEEPDPPGRHLLRLLREDGVLAPIGVLAALFLAGGAVLAEALLLRGLLGLGGDLALGYQRLGAMAALVIFLAALLLVDHSVVGTLLRMGRGLEARLRVAFLEKIPRLGDRYFQSRLTSDMAERSHAIHRVRQLPLLGGELIGAAFQLGFTTVGIAWLDPWLTPLALLAAGVALALPLAVHPALTERDLRVRSHAGALSRFYLDALLGAQPIRTHGADLAIRREHEMLLVEWARAGLRLQRAMVSVGGGQATAGFILAAALLLAHVLHAGASSGVLLLAFWALQIPALGNRIVVLARRYPEQRNLVLRLVEPLGAPEGDHAAAQPGDEKGGAVAVTLDGAGVVVAGHVLLSEVDLEVEAGSHVAVVGSSGAGKSTLLGLLLGWHRPSAGRVWIDGSVLDPGSLGALRRRTAWVDPEVHLWNRSLLDNLRYGNDGDGGVGRVLDRAALMEVLERLPEGLQTPLGEGGGLLSGGEGQRVRLARALLRRDVGLVLLDEPFRGLDRSSRSRLLSAARALWSEATLLCVTHDVEETLPFARVIVLDEGRVVEDGAPAALLERPDSRYRALLEADRQVRGSLWGGDRWRSLTLAGGLVVEDSR